VTNIFHMGGTTAGQPGTAGALLTCKFPVSSSISTAEASFLKLVLGCPACN